MNQFWRLFTSDYVQDFVDSVTIPTSYDLVESYRKQFDNEVKVHQENIASLTGKFRGSSQ
ncbi:MULTISPECIES: hypothetical protein [Prochlorococcus]|uniref:hypothetical protein n=1 Tax=Prochlorococcus TaxID=1218 RepID=UPI00053396F0|nr:MULTISPECIES: hypothetical protein [Prochlorococcus]KGG14157.1 putative protein family PM-25 [Prochlorococcus sp. MIT 0601]